MGDKEKYIPEYSNGEIQVCFGENISEDFARDFGKKIGYEFIPSDNPYLFKTEIGKENKAIKKFQKYKEFVEWAEKRDLRSEKRYEFIGNLETGVKNLDAYLERENFIKELNKIKNYIKEFDDSTID